jgi:hypothetical protein
LCAACPKTDHRRAADLRAMSGSILAAPLAGQSIGTRLEHIIATCDDFAHSGHLKKMISYCSSIG